MKPADEVRRELVQQWWAKAEEDLDVARHLLDYDTPYLNSVGFHAQQAAEKFMKALLVYYQIEIIQTHDLGKLLDLVSTREQSLADSLTDVTALNPYGVDVRYPSDSPEITPEEAENAIELATQVKSIIQPKVLDCQE